MRIAYGAVFAVVALAALVVPPSAAAQTPAKVPAEPVNGQSTAPPSEYMLQVLSLPTKCTQGGGFGALNDLGEAGGACYFHTGNPAHLTITPLLWRNGKARYLTPVLQDVGVRAVGDNGDILATVPTGTGSTPAVIHPHSHAVTATGLNKAFSLNPEGTVAVGSITLAHSAGAPEAAESVHGVASTLPGAGRNSRAYAMSDNGAIVGVDDGPALFTASGVEALPKFHTESGQGNDNAVATGVTDGGAVVGIESQTMTGDLGATAPFLYQDGQEIDLGWPPGFDYVTDVHINNQDVIVGTASNPGRSEAWIYEGHQFYNLQALIPATTGWQLTQANAINQEGQILVWGTRNGVGSSLLLTPTSTVQPSPLTTLSSLSISTRSVTLDSGRQYEFYSTGHWSDGETTTLGPQLTWGTSDWSVASVDEYGYRYGGGYIWTQRPGTTTITGYDGTLSVSSIVHVRAPTAISITPADPTLTVGTVWRPTATGTFPHGATEIVTHYCTWVSSDPAVATIETTTAQPTIKLLRSGTATITATEGSTSGSTTITVVSAS